MWSWIKRNPIFALGAVTVTITTFISFAAAEHLVSATVLAWVGLVLACLNALGTYLAHQASTSLAAPKAADGTPLKPVQPISWMPTTTGPITLATGGVVLGSTTTTIGPSGG